MDQEQREPIERWTTKRRAALVMRILKGETSVAEAARQHGVMVTDVESWQEQFLRAAENGLRRRPKDEDALKDEQIKKLKQKIGDLVVENDVLREALNPYPLGREMSDAEERLDRTSRNARSVGCWRWRARHSIGCHLRNPRRLTSMRT